MKRFLDTSVLVAAFLGDHPHHPPSVRFLASAERTSACCAGHSLAEAYSTITRLPVKPPISPTQALLFLDDVRRRLALITLDASDYWSTLEEAAERGLGGALIYDALLLRCAIKARAEAVYTWNTKDFLRLAPELAGVIRTP